MSGIEYDGQKLWGAGTFLAGKIADVPTASPLAMNNVTEGDVVAAANNFNMWVTYAGLISRAQLADIASSVTDAATAMNLAEAQLASAAKAS